MATGRLGQYGGVMAKDLRVDPIDLRLSSDHMDMHHTEVSTAHVAANGDIEAAQAGWVGASAAALQAKFAEWQEGHGDNHPRHRGPRRRISERRRGICLR
jgi:hypothetical protein